MKKSFLIIIILASVSLFSQDNSSVEKSTISDKDMVLFYKTKKNIEAIGKNNPDLSELKSEYAILSQLIDEISGNVDANEKMKFLISSKIKNLHEQSYISAQGIKKINFMYYLMVFSGIIIILFIVYFIYNNPGRKNS